MPRRFVTETLQESIPVVFFGEKTAFLEALVRQVGRVFPEYEGRFAQDFSRFSPPIPPLAVIYVTEGELDAHELVRAAKKAGEWGSPVVCMIPAENAQHTLGQIRKVLKPTLVLSLWEMRAEPAVVRACLDAFFTGRKSGGVVSVGKPRLAQLPRNQEPRPKGEQELRRYSMFSHLPAEHEITSPFHRRVKILPQKPILPDILGHGQPLEQSIQDDVLHTLFRKQPTFESRGKHATFSLQELFDNIRSFFSRKSKIKKPAPLVLGIWIVVFALFGAIFAFEYAKRGVQASLSSFQNTVFSDAAPQDALKKEHGALARRAVLYKIVRPIVDPLYPLVGRQQDIADMDQMMTVLEKGGEAMTALSAFSQYSADAYLRIVSQQDELPFTALQQAQNSADLADKKLSELAAEIAAAKDNSLIADEKTYAAVQKQLAAIRKNLLSAEHIIPILPEVLGEKGKKTYLVLIQNPLELRPTGGFLASFALVTFDKGKLLDIQVQDSYAADSLLNGKVEPPADLAKYLSEKQWYLRDGNWNPDFPKTARQTAWFIEKELGIQVDGVVGLNAFVLRDLLRGTQPIRIESYDNEQVSADNILERMQNRSELTLSLTGTKKKEYITALAESLFTAMQGVRSANNAQGIEGALVRGLESSDLLLYFNDADMQKTFSALGWGGEVMTPPCPQQFAANPCFVDTVFQVDSNVGVNRANYYLHRSLNHAVVLTESAAIHTHTIRLTNTAPSAAWPAGSYKDYVRLYVPDFSQLTNVVVNQVPLSAGVVTQDFEFGKRIIGFPIDVPVGRTVTVTVSYTTQISATDKTSYALFFQRQPGSDPSPMSLSLQVQKPLHAALVAPEGAIVGNIIQFDTTLDKHQYMAVEVLR